VQFQLYIGKFLLAKTRRMYKRVSLITRTNTDYLSLQKLRTVLTENCQFNERKKSRIENCIIDTHLISKLCQPLSLSLSLSNQALPTTSRSPFGEILTLETNATECCHSEPPNPPTEDDFGIPIIYTKVY